MIDITALVTIRLAIESFPRWLPDKMAALLDLRVSIEGPHLAAILRVFKAVIHRRKNPTKYVHAENKIYILRGTLKFSHNNVCHS